MARSPRLSIWKGRRLCSPKNLLPGKSHQFRRVSGQTLKDKPDPLSTLSPKSPPQRIGDGKASLAKQGWGASDQAQSVGLMPIAFIVRSRLR